MNRLAGESSAYLRQHADNPVHWWPFGTDAFAAARQRAVPVFLSIGYAACHWCHVMAHESFEDEATAAYLNAHFVSIKVDREERPDVDSIYMSATQAMTGAGGWPMSVFLTPDGRAFFAGTYFPPSPLPGRASFLQVMQAVTEAWTERRPEVEASAAQLAEQMAKGLKLNRDLIGPLSASLAAGGQASAGQADAGYDGVAQDDAAQANAGHRAVKALAGQEDLEFGGFGDAPKFPPSPVLSFLLRHAGGTASTAQEAAQIAGRTLESMATSALFDQVEGGFARYAVDRQWSVPHFEKMLYDNAQLLRLYAHWSRLEGPHQALARRVAAETAEWMLTELALPGVSAAAGDRAMGSGSGGAFASSLDADTVIDGLHQEGGTYLWTRAQLQEVLGENGDAVAALMGVGGSAGAAAGSPLHPGQAMAPVQSALWAQARPLLREARRQRPQPERDEKVVAGWNGMALAGLAEAGAILDRPDLIEAARRTGSYLADVHLDGGGGLWRVSHQGRAQGIAALLEDYAFCADGFFALYAATAEQRWYELGRDLTSAALARFVIDGQLQDSGGESAELQHAQGGMAAVDPLDNVTPSGAAAFAQALLTEAAYSGSSSNRRLAEEMVGYAGRLADRAPRAVGAALAVLEAVIAGPVQVAITGTESAERAGMIRAVVSSASPGLVLAVGGSNVHGDDVVPLLRDRPAGAEGSPRAYLCRNMVCYAPAESAAEVRSQLGL